MIQVSAVNLGESLVSRRPRDSVTGFAGVFCWACLPNLIPLYLFATGCQCLKTFYLIEAAKMAKKKKLAHGGRREGAGRPVGPEGRTVLVAATVPGELAERLDAYAAKMDLNRSQAVTEAIRGLLDANR